MLLWWEISLAGCLLCLEGSLPRYPHGIFLLPRGLLNEAHPPMLFNVEFHLSHLLHFPSPSTRQSRYLVIMVIVSHLFFFFFSICFPQIKDKLYKAKDIFWVFLFVCFLLFTVVNEAPNTSALGPGRARGLGNASSWRWCLNGVL